MFHANLERLVMGTFLEIEPHTMKAFLQWSIVVVAAATGCCSAAATTAANVYEATISELGGSGVTGTAIVFAGSTPGMVAYAGFGRGLAPNLAATDCTAKNGCGAHIHGGTGCASKEEQGEHYYVGVTVDPWLVERYTSDSFGEATFAGVLAIGTDDIEGRTFLLHNATGSRVGCGVLKLIPASQLLLGHGADGSVGLTEINDSKASGSVVVYQPDDEHVCHFGSGSGLVPNVVSFLNGGTQCTNANGCGTHIHSGTSCANAASQGGHYYNMAVVAADPWKNAGYRTTDGNGNAFYTGCLQTGETVFKDKVVVLHGEDGSRVACGVLQHSDSCEALKCTSVLGDGYHIAHKSVAMNTLYRWLGRPSQSCQTRCMPAYAASTFGFTCGRCPAPSKSD
jgi:Cu/Zn superoxide dismutase